MHMRSTSLPQYIIIITIGTACFMYEDNISITTIPSPLPATTVTEYNQNDIKIKGDEHYKWFR